MPLQQSTLRSSPSLIDTLHTGWVRYFGSAVASYASSTTFTVTGDYTSIFTNGRRLRIYHATASAYKYVTVVQSSYSAPTTTVTVVGNALLDQTYSSVWIDLSPVDYAFTEESQTGWIESAHTWTYASATTFTIADVDLTTVYRTGTRVRFKQGGAYQYGTILSSTFATNTTVTLATNADYSIANAAITDPAFSYINNPYGYPHYFNWSPSLGGFSSNPTGTIYRFSLTGKMIQLLIRQATAGTSSATSFTITAPVPAKTLSNYTHYSLLAFVEDNGSPSTTRDFASIGSGSSTITLFKNNSASGWTNSGNKSANFRMEYEID